MQEIITEKKKIRRQWQQNRTPIHKHKLNIIIQTLQREIRKIMQESINSYLKELTYKKDSDFLYGKLLRELKDQ